MHDSPHSWNVTPREAIQIQKELRDCICHEYSLEGIRFIAGADIAWERTGPRDYAGYAGVIVYEYPSLREVERTWVYARGTFPYVPGLLSFREIPLLLPAFGKLNTKPDVIFVDGQGYAHPRRIGIASHLGLLLDVPTIGCAKSRLIGTYRDPGLKKGCHTRLLDRGEVIGAVVRTRDNVNPIFVSAGHRMDLAHAVRLCLRCSDGFRIPKPTRIADHFVGELLRERAASSNMAQD